MAKEAASAWAAVAAGGAAADEQLKAYKALFDGQISKTKEAMVEAKTYQLQVTKLSHECELGMCNAVARWKRCGSLCVS